MVKETLKKSGYEGSLPSGVVVCGGGASTVGLEDVAKRILRVPVRVGVPQGVSGLIEEVSSPAYAAAIGMIIFAARQLPVVRIPLISKVPQLKQYLEKVIGWVKGFLP